jgi:hypothetical protein
MVEIGNRAKRLLRLRDESGKFTKAQSYYVDDAFLKSFRCGNCIHYTGDGGCSLVSGQGPPGPGKINPQGACALYNARAPRVQWIQHMWGRDEKEGIPPEVIRATAFMITYGSLDEEPPQELQEKALISADTVARVLPWSTNSAGPDGDEY